MCGGRLATRQLMGVMQSKAPSAAPIQQLNDFNSSFYVVYGGPSTIFQGDAVSSVQLIMRDTYNNAVGCDAGLILNTVTIADQTLFVAESTRHNRHLARSYTLLNYYTVSGQCRACATGSKLFNDAVRRRLQTAADNFNSAGLMNFNAAGFNEITSVAASNGAPLTEAPTARPTDTPTSLPTMFPTSYPSETPTLRPTLVPTTRPTRRPTRFRATRTPTRAPTNAPVVILLSTSRANQIAAAPEDSVTTNTFFWKF